MGKYLRSKAVLLFCVLGAGIGTALAAAFGFGFVSTYGTGGLSAPFALTATSYSRGLAISSSDSSQSLYSLVQAQPTNQNCSSGPCYQGPYYIARRTASGAIDTSFGLNGYVTSFPNSSTAGSDPNFQFHSLCVDPGTGDLVLIGQDFMSAATGPGGNEAIVVERVTVTAGSATATLDAGFNSGQVLNITPPTYGNGQAKACRVANFGPNTPGPIFVLGSDQQQNQNNCTGNCTTAGSLVLAKVKPNGSLDASFGNGGVSEFAVSSGSVAQIPEPGDLTGNGYESNFPDLVIVGDYYLPSSNGNTTMSMVVAVNRCTGALDAGFNGSGMLLNPTLGGVNYSQALLGHIIVQQRQRHRPERAVWKYQQRQRQQQRRFRDCGGVRGLHDYRRRAQYGCARGPVRHCDVPQRLQPQGRRRRQCQWPGRGQRR